MERTTGQHVLPRFLLAGFVARARKKESYTYVFRRSTAKGVLVNIADAAKQRLFYGEPSVTGVEDALQRQEGKYAQVVESIRGSRALNTAAIDALLELVANLAVRTSHLRTGMSRETARMFEAVQGVFTGEQASEIMCALLRRQPDTLRKAIRGAIRQVSAFPREPQLHMLLDQTLEAYLLESLDKGALPLGEITTVLRAVAEQLNWEEIATNSHIQALQRGVSPQTRVDVCRRLEWTTVSTPANALILGDFGPLGVSEETGDLRPLSVLGKEVAQVLLPLSSDLLLVGHSRGAAPKVDVHALRERTAAMSSDFFCAAQDTTSERELLPRIGTESALLTESEFTAIAGSLVPAEESPQDLPCSYGLTLEIGRIGTPANGDAATRELEAIARSIRSAGQKVGVPIETHIRLVVTEDLAATVSAIAQGYGYTADIRTEGRSVAVQGKTLYSKSGPTFEATIVLDAALWANDAPVDVVMRLQLVLAQITHALLDGRKFAEKHTLARPAAQTFDAELHMFADELLSIYDAERLALPLLSLFVSAMDGEGRPAEPGERVAIEYLGTLRTLLGRLGAVVDEVIQPYREHRVPLDAIMPATFPPLRDLMLVLAKMLGMSSARFVTWLPTGLEASPGFVEYLKDDWELLIAAFQESEPKEAEERIVRVVRGVLARLGLYFDDVDEGTRDLLVGTPRFISRRPASQ